MATVWVWRVMMLLAVPTLALLGVAVATQLPFALATRSADLPGLVAWAVAVAVGVALVIGSFLQRRRGRTGLATFMVGLVAMPAAFGLGLFLLIVLLFILKG